VITDKQKMNYAETKKVILNKGELVFPERKEVILIK
jgi:hypothetical protein